MEFFSSNDLFDVNWFYVENKEDFSIQNNDSRNPKDSEIKDSIADVNNTLPSSFGNRADKKSLNVSYHNIRHKSNLLFMKIDLG